GRAVRLERIDTIADGLAPPSTDDFILRFVRRYVDDVILVSDTEIVAAMRLIIGRAKLVAEPSGAASVAGLLSGRAGIPAGANVVCIVSGGNVDLARLKELL